MEDAEDARKLRYALAAYGGSDPFEVADTLDEHVVRALDWIAERDADQVISERERMIRALEEAGERIWASGLSESWHNGADPITRAAAGHVNGHLFEQLLRASGYGDWKCARLFREGTRSVCMLYSFCVALRGRREIGWGVGTKRDRTAYRCRSRQIHRRARS